MTLLKRLSTINCYEGTFSHVPKERLGFKLRGGIDKQVTINVKQVTNNIQLESDDPQSTYTGGLYIERCFGILLAPGRSVKHSDMRLLEMVSGSSGGSGCSVCALWNAGESALAAFNVASGDGAPAYMSLALDLVIRGIPDPLRLVIETPVKIFPPSERFWYYSKRPLVQQFYINLKESVDALGQLQYEVASIEPSDELDRSRLNLPLSLSSLLPSPLSSAPAPPSPSEPDSDGDEPLLSGTGEVSKDCGEDVLVNWAQVLRSWTGPRPRALNHLVRVGVPEALRGEVWLRLAGVDQNDKLMETYRTLISKDCPFEAVIQRDIARTFPAHDFFREAGGLGQDSLLRMARAYAVYDHEVGYCQGLSFLAATLLLHVRDKDGEFESDAQRELRQIFQGQTQIHDILRDLNKKVDEVIGKQMNSLSMLTAVYSHSQGQPIQPGAAPAQIPSLPIGRHDWDALVANNQIMINTIAELKGLIIDVSRKSDSLAAASGAGAAGASPQLIGEVRDSLAQVKATVTGVAQRLAAVGSPQALNVPACPEVSCVSFTGLLVVVATQLALMLVYAMYKERKEAQAKKFF